MKPVWLMLHGTGASADLAVQETRLAEFGQQHGLIVAFPEALPLDATRAPAFLSNPRRWNDGSTQAGEKLHTMTDDIGYLNAVISDLLTRTSGNPHQVYLAGFSNGAGMTLRFASMMAPRLAGIAVVAGYAPPELPAPERPVRTLFLLGDADPLMPMTPAHVRLPWYAEPWLRPSVLDGWCRWAVMNGCQAEPILQKEDNGIRQYVHPVNQSHAAEVRRMTISGLGHHWPGGRGLLNPRIAGPASDRVQANDEIFKFFQGL